LPDPPWESHVSHPTPRPKRSASTVDLGSQTPVLDELIRTTLDDLRRKASAQLSRLRNGETLQTTALVHEAYLRIKRAGRQDWNGPQHFLAYAARTMRSIIVEHMRRRRADAHPVTLDPENTPVRDVSDPIVMIALDDELIRLAAMDPRLAQIVELRFFAGLTNDEAADAIGISPSLAKLLWARARAELERRLGR
jgi:RNA polymerase sigma factor (TIGR02999 family)